MAATFNAEALPSAPNAQRLTQPAAAASGGSTVPADASITSHVNATDPHGDRAFATGLMATHEGTNGIHQIADVAGLQGELDLAPFESTGAVAGFGLTIFSATQVTVAAGTAIFIDQTDPAAPLQSKVVVPSTNVTITSIGSQLVTYLALTSAGAFVQQATAYTPLQRRTLCPLGIVAHVNMASINAVATQVPSLHATGNQLHDLLEVLGTLNVVGNVYGPNGVNRSLNRTAGTIFKFGANPNYDDPHNLPIAAMTAGNLFYHTSTAVIAGPTTTINVTQFESPLGTLATVSNNKFTIQRIYMPQTGVTRIQYGQHEYASMADAEAALETEAYTVEPTTASTAMLRAFMIVKKNASDASDATTVKFFSVGKFGSVAVGGAVAITSASIIAALGYTPETNTALPAHVAAADPHTQYLLAASLRRRLFLGA